MSERVRSTRRGRVMAYVDYADGHGAYEETTIPLPLSDEHYARGERLRRRRIARRLSLCDLAAAVGLSVADVSQIQAGTAEATEEEWARLEAATGGEEENG